jgi:pSer/pThr/pTyr-binding forkhead associated (FHA) protein
VAAVLATAPNPLLARVAALRRPRAIRLVPPPRGGRSGFGWVIGRSRHCDLVLGEPTVSRLHAELREENTGWVIADLGSTNGTWVNGWRVQRAELSAGDEVVLGAQRLVFGDQS